MSEKTIKKFLKHTARLYEQEREEPCGSPRLGLHMRQWYMWLKALFRCKTNRKSRPQNVHVFRQEPGEPTRAVWVIPSSSTSRGRANGSSQLLAFLLLWFAPPRPGASMVLTSQQIRIPNAVQLIFRLADCHCIPHDANRCRLEQDIPTVKGWLIKVWKSSGDRYTIRRCRLCNVIG
jgi:hypothetical protein